MVEAKLRKCHSAKIKIAKHWLYNTEIFLLIKSIVWLIRLIYLKVYVAPRIIILNYTLSLLKKKYRSYWYMYCFLNNFCCFESIEIRHIYNENTILLCKILFLSVSIPPRVWWWWWRCVDNTILYSKSKTGYTLSLLKSSIYMYFSLYLAEKEVVSALYTVMVRCINSLSPIQPVKK